MSEPNKPAGSQAGQSKADTGPVPDRPVSHPPGPQDRPAGNAAGRGTVESASAAPGEKRSVSPPPAGAAPAAESGDPAVQKALADLQTAQQNLAAAQGGEDRDARIATEEQAVRDAEARLAELGYE